VAVMRGQAGIISHHPAARTWLGLARRWLAPFSAILVFTHYSQHFSNMRPIRAKNEETFILLLKIDLYQGNRVYLLKLFLLIKWKIQTLKRIYVTYDFLTRFNNPFRRLKKNRFLHRWLQN